MARFGLLCTLLLFGTAYGLLGERRCSWGPGYWCKGIDTAKECGAIDHCAQAVWSKQEVKSDAVCDTCEEVVGLARLVVSLNATEEEILEVLENACTVLPDALKDTCKTLVETYGPEVIQLLKSELDPKAVCQALKLCQEGKALPKKPAQDKFIDLCPECELVVGKAKDLVDKNSTEPEVIDFLKVHLCEQLGALAAACNTTMDTYGPIVYKLLEQKIDPDKICKAIGLCKNATIALVQKPIKPVKQQPNDLCDDCKLVMTEVQALIKNNKSEAEVIDYLKVHLCEKLGGLAAECNSTMDTFGPVIFQLLESKLDPDAVCKAIKLCPTSDFIAKLQEMQKGPNSICDDCEEVMQKAQDYISDNATQAELIKLLKDDFCTLLGGLEAECDSLMDQYGPIIFNLLEQELDPEKVCQAVGFCPSLKALSMAKLKPAKKVVQTEKVGQSVGCIICEFVMQIVDEELSANSTEKEITDALDKVCSHFPDTIRDECTDFVNEYGPAVVQLLKLELDPQRICSTIGLCDNSNSFRLLKGMGSELCPVCKILVQYADSLLLENSTKADIKAVVDKICNFLPSSIKTECHTVVEQYGDAIAELMEQALDPDFVCTKVGACDSEDSLCSLGPGYWCSGMEQAKACNAVEHCKTHWWN
ncbi:prosaposin-like isoform X1 [Branchiostoma floridae]|uniref:Prosaposin-like isoform X1 n=1 Tax=Branchiostoma floridae TaxID=7739 RepID=A0A9J7KRN9_BRAFL|nr:prosaposin-like isoform X1 [Branchiostoma floridae]